MSDMTPETAAQLREPFPASEVGKLPRVTCAQCRERACQQHPRQRCQVCRNYISTAHIHLDYVGHAEVTDRLLEVDPRWTWAPVSWDEQHNLPAFDGLGGLWIELTVAGVTRYGYGHADGKRGGDAVKESIGDAIRNAAMRYGVALDLWRRTEAEAVEAAPTEPEASQTEDPGAALRAEIAELAEAKGYPLATVSADFTRVHGGDIRSATTANLAEYRDRFRGYDAREAES